jgi:hypothetical protein
MIYSSVFCFEAGLKTVDNANKKVKAINKNKRKASFI